MSEGRLTPQQNLKPALDAALERAIKAEKAYLSLKWDTYIEKMRNATTSAEQEYAAKINLYSSLPEQQVRLKDEFQRRTHEINMRIDSAKEIHAMCIEALEKGLCMDELPLSSTDSNEVRVVIHKLLTDRQYNNIVTNNTNGSAQAEAYDSMTAHIEPAVVQNGYSNYGSRYAHTTVGVRSAGSASSMQRGLVGSGSSSNILAVTARHAVTTAPFAAAQVSQPVGSSLQYYTAAQAPTQRSLTTNQIYYNHQQIASYPSARLPSSTAKATAPSPQQLTNNLALSSPYVTNQLSSLPSTSSATNTSAQIQAVSSPLSTSAVNDLDNFVIDDDEMFSSTIKSLPDANILNRNEPKPLVTANKIIDTSSPDDGVNTKASGDAGENISKVNATVGDDSSTSDVAAAAAVADLDIIDSIDDGNSDEGSTIGEDDEEFATRLATRQGAPSRNAPPIVVPKTKENARETFKDIAVGKSDPAYDEVDWTKEPWLSVVQQMVAKYKINKKVASQYLQAALLKTGDIKELDAVWAEAERSMQSALKPNPTEQKTKAIANSGSQPALNKAAASAGSAASAGNALKNESKGGLSNYKTVICDNWQRTRKCPRGEYCTFAHGKGDLRPRQSNSAPAPTSIAKPANGPRNSYYKVILCRNFEAGHCEWGGDCIFAHGEEELRKSHSEENMRENAVESTDGSPHPEPCVGQQCPFKLEYLLKKTGMCERHKQGLCKFGKECKFAHSRKELKPMPKWEMCLRHQARKCMHARTPEKCVYAHSKEELRKKPAELESNQKSVTHSTGGGGRLIPAGSRYVPWAGEDRHPTTPKDGDECLICMGPLLTTEKKNLLKCGHNSFHERCISQWVNEGRASCPVCREPAKLPDLFRAPAGFQPEEFPGLGL